LALGSAAIAVASLVYFGEELAPFVLEKLPLPLEDVWMLALRAHVVAAVICLPACLLLFSTAVVRRAPRLHRWLGRVTGVLVLLALGPSGSLPSLFPRGGLPPAGGVWGAGPPPPRRLGPGGARGARAPLRRAPPLGAARPGAAERGRDLARHAVRVRRRRRRRKSRLPRQPVAARRRQLRPGRAPVDPQETILSALEEP